MPNNWETEGDGAKRIAGRTAGLVKSLTAYGLFGLGIVAFYSFFAPFVGTDPVAWYAVVLPPIHAPTESQGTVVDAAPLIAGVVTCGLAVWLR